MTKLYVSNLPFSATPPEIEALFTSHGRVSACRVITDRDSGRPRGFAFVVMPNDSEAEAAIQALTGSIFGGRPLRVSIAVDKPRPTGGETMPIRTPAGGGGKFDGCNPRFLSAADREEFEQFRHR